MPYDFDRITERKNTDSVKYDSAAARGKPDGLLPLWLADMDIPAPPCVVEALAEKSRHGIFGYSESGPAYFKALESWFKQRFNWQIQPQWLIKTPGLVFALHTLVRALTKKGEAVLIQQPVFYPFCKAVQLNGRRLVVNELIYQEGSYVIDFADFEEKIRREKVKLFILCSPHNPVGRVWSRQELEAMGDICLKYGVTVIADEIHGDFIYPGHQQLVFANLKPEFAQNSITCTSPSKTFNLAGLQISHLFIPNPRLHHLVQEEINRIGYSEVGIMGLVAAKAAYEKGADWLAALQMYLEGNLSLIRDFIARGLPIELVEPQGTYLVWLNFRQLGLSQPQLDELIEKNARLWLDSGTIFGAGGEGFQRMNIACPRPLLHQALTQLTAALQPV